MSEWIDIVVQKPAMARTYLVYGSLHDAVYVARWMPRKEKWVFPAAQGAFTVTHWMPLPEPPQ